MLRLGIFRAVPERAPGDAASVRRTTLASRPASTRICRTPVAWRGPATRGGRRLVRLLLFSDLHLDAPLRLGPARGGPAPPAGAAGGLRDLRASPRRSASTRCCCAGDLYEQERFTPGHGRVPARRFARLHPCRSSSPRATTTGCGPASLYRQVATGPTTCTCSPDDRLTPVTLADGLTLWGAAHRAPANTPGFLDGLPGRPGRRAPGSVPRLRAGWRWPFQEAGKVPHAPFRAEQIAGGRPAPRAGRATSTRRATRPTTPTRATRSR